MKKIISPTLMIMFFMALSLNSFAINCVDLLNSEAQDTAQPNIEIQDILSQIGVTEVVDFSREEATTFFIELNSPPSAPESGGLLSLASNLASRARNLIGREAPSKLELFLATRPSPETVKELNEYFLSFGVKNIHYSANASAQFLQAQAFIFDYLAETTWVAGDIKVIESMPVFPRVEYEQIKRSSLAAARNRLNSVVSAKDNLLIEFEMIATGRVQRSAVEHFPTVLAVLTDKRKGFLAQNPSLSQMEMLNQYLLSFGTDNVHYSSASGPYITILREALNYIGQNFVNSEKDLEIIEKWPVFGRAEYQSVRRSALSDARSRLGQGKTSREDLLFRWETRAFGLFVNTENHAQATLIKEESSKLLGDILNSLNTRSGFLSLNPSLQDIKRLNDLLLKFGVSTIHYGGLSNLYLSIIDRLFSYAEGVVRSQADLDFITENLRVFGRAEYESVRSRLLTQSRRNMASGTEAERVLVDLINPYSRMSDKMLAETFFTTVMQSLSDTQNGFLSLRPTPSEVLRLNTIFLSFGVKAVHYSKASSEYSDAINLLLNYLSSQSRSVEEAATLISGFGVFARVEYENVRRSYMP